MVADDGAGSGEEPSHGPTPASVVARRAVPVPVVVAVVVVVAVALAVGRSAMGSGSSGSPTTSTPTASQTEFLDCVKARESGGDYTAIGPGAQAFGAYQITPQTWDNTVAHYGWTGLTGMRPDRASPADQDRVAMALLQWQGAEPWGGGCTPS